MISDKALISLGAIVNIWWGVAIFYGIITGDIKNSGVWVIFASFLILTGILFLINIFVISSDPVKHIENNYMLKELDQPEKNENLP